jgi:peptidase E
MGGGGFSMEPRNLRLDRYILAQSHKNKPRICFLPTASGDSRDYIRRFHLAMEKHDCIPTTLTLFRRDTRDPADIIANQDILYVGGGNTANLLAIWRLHGVDRAIQHAWQDGVILTGVSAGMICWFQSSVTDSFGPLRELNDGLGLLPGSACPHYDGEKNRRPTFHRPPGVAADDGAAIHFIGGKIHRCVASRPHAKAYRVALDKGKVVEETLETTYLE